MAGLCIFPHDRSTWKVLRRAGSPGTGGHRKAAPWRQVFPAVMSPSNLHTQPPSPLGPGWEQAPSSYTGCCQPEEKLRAAERRGPAPLGTGAPTGPRTARGAPRNRCGSDSRRGTQPARVIHCFQQCCGPAGRGGEGGGEAGSRGMQPPGVGGSSRGAAPAPPLPSPRPHWLTPPHPVPSATAQHPLPVPGTFPSRRPLQ